MTRRESHRWSQAPKTSVLEHFLQKVADSSERAQQEDDHLFPALSFHALLKAVANQLNLQDFSAQPRLSSLPALQEGATSEGPKRS